ncbi:putative TIM-barrel fold metal-dependent hydrolase [Rhizobium sp. BIGb0125]|uniref:amidohydrolase family protein n=1 Tax=Rhizobium sp. BIGb0125 TaxID=2940618 RepID=UPI002168678C|nr:amidohydrolase [Rhizobium sp. BIGb0125]MCS4244416.1 putative TIM-barrel fold metal-dependent hydrolase [Rhizobium sp. BIGb0125]
MATELIDTHQHLILRGDLGYAWTEEVPAIASGTFDQNVYAEQAAGCNITATIFMESGVDDVDYQSEARLVSRLVGSGYPKMLGVIASCRPETDEGFDAWLEECGDLNVVGFRRILQVMPDDLSRSETYRRNVRKIGKAGYPVDLCFDGRQLSIAYDLVRADPDTVFILDHCGRPDIASGDFAAWRQEMIKLSELPNFWVKLSGLPTYCHPSGSKIDDVKPYSDTVLELFGPSRMVWGGDWPVIDVGGGLANWVNITTELLSGLSADERQLIGTLNAKQVYLGKR